MYICAHMEKAFCLKSASIYTKWHKTLNINNLNQCSCCVVVDFVNIVYYIFTFFCVDVL